MQIVTFLIALAAAAVTGFANQRGGICMVAAIDDIVTTRRFGRMIALFETSLWVAGGFVLLKAIGVRPMVPSGYAIGLATIAGSVVFALGALINGACLFGTVARLGSHQWAYAATLAGLFAGSLAMAHLRLPPGKFGQPLLLGACALAAVIVAGLVIGRVGAHGMIIRRSRIAALDYLWSPYVATTIIGIGFFLAFVAAGDWEYSNFLRDLARGNTFGWAYKSLLAASLFAGAIVGGRTAGLAGSATVDLVSLARCAIGGFLMGVGASLIPGGNTSLVLLSMPLLWPYAWLAFATMCLTIFIAKLIRLRR